jgi:Permeases
MEKLFKLNERNTTVRTEIVAGITTFLAMAYILAVNPGILSASGMDAGAVFTATAISSAVATLVMAFVANLPFALAPGMGLNAFLAFTVCLGMGYPWQFALTAVFVEGLIFIILTIFNIREAIVNSIPLNLKKAIGVGIGLFIAFIGMQNAGIIVANESTCVGLGDIISKGPAAVAILGLIVTSILLLFNVRGALLIGIFATTIIGIPFGVTKYAGGSFLPPSLAPTFWKFDFSNIFSVDFLFVMFTFLFVDMFDTVGTLIGCATKAGILNDDGTIPNCKEALFADAIGTTVGAVLGTSTVTTFVESSAGVAEGGKTGLTALTVGVLFLASLFLAPLFLSIPSAATAPVLIIVGFLMITPVTEIDFKSVDEGIPAFLTILFMVVSYSIADGIMFGILSYVILKLAKKDFKAISVPTIVVAILFLIKLIMG